MSWFALKTLLTDRGKALTALLGVVFSLVLVDIQGGLYFGLIGKASLLTDRCTADLWIGHRQSENVDFAHTIPVQRINRIRGVPGVAAAEPYIVGKGIATLADGGFEDVWVIGADPESMLGAPQDFTSGAPDELLRPDAVSIDELDAGKLGNPALGEVIEVNGRRARIVATTRGVLGFMTTPYLYGTLDTSRRLTGTPASQCSYFLVRAASGTDLGQLRRVLAEQVPELDVMTAAEFGQQSQDYFLGRTGIGISFGASTLLGLLVGLSIVGQSLYALALDHLTEYATLKAIGAEDRQIGTVVIMQALTVAAAGSVIGIVIILSAQRTLSTPIAPILIPTSLLLVGVVVVFAICLISSVLPVVRIRRLDPAMVLQG